MQYCIECLYFWRVSIRYWQSRMTSGQGFLRGCCRSRRAGDQYREAKIAIQRSARAICTLALIVGAGLVTLCSAMFPISSGMPNTLVEGHQEGSLSPLAVGNVPAPMPFTTRLPLATI